MQLHGKEVALLSVFLSSILLFFTINAIAPLVFSLLSLAYFWLFNKNKIYEFELSRKTAKETLLVFFAIVTVAISIAITFSIFGMNDLSKIKETVKGFDLNLILLAVIVSPIAEELLFRGALIEIFYKFGQLKSALLSSSVFAFLHFGYGSLAEIIGAFAIAVVFSLYYAKRRELLPLFVAHALFNLIAILYYLIL